MVKISSYNNRAEYFWSFNCKNEARKTAHRLTVTIPDDPGAEKDLCDLMRIYSFKCVSILTSQMDVEEGFRQVLIRFQADEGDSEKILADVKCKYNNTELTVD